MKIAILAALLVLGAVQHQEPPPGWFCRPPAKNVPADHACSCQRIDRSEDCDGPPIEQPVCRSWCWPRHCTCPVVCEPKLSH